MVLIIIIMECMVLCREQWFLFSFKYYFSITVDILYYSVLVLGAQHRSVTILLYQWRPSASVAQLVPYVIITLALTISPMLCLHPWDCSVTISLCFLIPSPSLQSSGPTSHLAPVRLFSVSEPLSVLFVHLFCSLDSTNEWNHRVLVFLWLIYFSQDNTL